MGREADTNELGDIELLHFTAHTTEMFSTATDSIMFSIW